jgi:electron transport complex protein RnfC
MMGIALNRTDIPVMKGTSGVLLLPEDESHREQSMTCIRCGRCVNVCPMNLEPYLLNQLAQQESCDELYKNKVMDCIECGSCSYTCPANIPLLDYIKLGKNKTGQMLKSTK